MAGYPPPGYDPRAQRRFLRDQARAQRAAYRAQREQMRYRMRAMRRGSILGPVLLIAAGVVFLLLQTGHLEQTRLWTWYAHWWPFIPLLAGSILLSEWALDRHLLRDPRRQPYRRTLGGGATVLVLCLVGLGLVAGNVHDYPSGYSRLFPGLHIDRNSLDEFFGDKHESDQTLDLAFNGDTALNVVNPRGDVTVSGTSDDGEVHVAIHKQVYANSDSTADAKAQQLVPATATAGAALNLTMPSLDGARADLTITVPASAATTVTANHGDIHIASIRAAVSATANRGDIDLSAITGPARAHINSGGSSIAAHSLNGGLEIKGRGQDLTLADISGAVTITGEFFGTTALERIAGSIHFHTSRTDLQFARLDGATDISSGGITADSVMGPVVLTTSNRNISLKRVAGDISVTNRNGSIELTAAPALGNIVLEDRNGMIDATMPEKAGFSVDARTTDGDVSTDFPLTTRGSEDDKTLTGNVGGGGPLLRIATTSSDISVRKAQVEEMPAVSPAAPKITLAPPTGAKAPHPAKTATP